MNLTSSPFPKALVYSTNPKGKVMGKENQEITFEMVEAGVCVLASHGLLDEEGGEDCVETVRAIYEVMHQSSDPCAP